MIDNQCRKDKFIDYDRQIKFTLLCSEDHKSMYELDAILTMIPLRGTIYL